MKPSIKKFKDNPAVANAFAKDLVELLRELTQVKTKVTISLSGGSTPKLLFEVLAREYSDSIDWCRVHFFWGDERCVEPDDPESNFGEASKLFLGQIEIPSENVRRIHGELDPEDACTHYEQVIRKCIETNDAGEPIFDIMILGMGSDGHTASIFPHQIELLNSKKDCEIAVHPESGQKRITLTGKVINASERVIYLITGSAKAPVLAEILSKSEGASKYPVAHVMPEGRTTFYLDDAAAAEIPN